MRRVFVWQRCVSKIALGMLTMKTWWSTARLWYQLVWERHTSIMESFGLSQSNKFIWPIMGVFPMCHIQRQPMLYGSQSALIARASTGPWDAASLAGSESCFHLCYWLWFSISIGASDDFRHSTILKSGALVGQGSILITFIESCMS